ncbi:MAG TPA: thioesterase [Clostridiales bacterium]|nr:thioesterase [Clostridiales bacterium]
MDLIENIRNDLFAKYIGVELIQVEEGYAKAEMKIKQIHLNGVGMVQGGAIFTLADYAFAAASNSKGTVTVGINNNISYIKSPKGKKLIATAKEVSYGRKICTYTVDVTDENGELIAQMNAMGYIRQPKI